MMNNSFVTDEKELQKFASLRDSIEESRADDVEKRLASDVTTSDLEHNVGAFIEEYPEYLRPFVSLFYKHGYVLEPASGFCGEFGECQALSGHFIVSDVIQNKLNTIGVKLLMHDKRALKFWPQHPDIKKISLKIKKILEILPKKNPSPATSVQAMQFRMKYEPENVELRNQNTFERLQFDVKQKKRTEVRERIAQNPSLSEIEARLGAFIEMLEPQVRHAVIVLNQKGYSTDKSGFGSSVLEQTIEGDFLIDEQAQEKLRSLDVQIETNPSGYTKISFTPQKADIEHITARWNEIVEIIPDMGSPADQSMTKESRDIRLKYGLAV